MTRAAIKRSDDETDGNGSQTSGIPRAPSRLKKRQSSHRKNAGGGPAGARSGWALIWLVALGGVLGLLVYSYRTLVPRAQIVESQRSMPTPVVLEHHCKEHIGPPRIIRVTDTVWVAVGYDLANTILIKTSAGHVIVDVAMSPLRAKVIRQALIEAAGDAPIHTIIYTHSHIDHVGGASGWAANATRIWATDAVTAHFFKQYGVFRKVRVVVGVVDGGLRWNVVKEKKGRRRMHFDEMMKYISIKPNPNLCKSSFSHIDSIHPHKTLNPFSPTYNRSKACVAPANTAISSHQATCLAPRSGPAWT